MRKMIAATLSIALVLAVGAGVLYSAPDDLSDIDGMWVGKVKVKAFDMSGEDDDWKGKEPVEVEIDLEGRDIRALIHVEEGPVFDLRGYIGDGHFWMTGETESGPLMWVGHVKAKGRRIVGRLLGGEEQYALEIAVQLKRPKEQDIPK
ncbi:MAG: hypothetical protein ABFS86_12510 [Planctomycetota bacterium]